MVTLQLQQLSVPAGQRLLIEDLSWENFDAILSELGDHRASRIAYHRGTLEIRMPTPEHEVDKELIGDVVKLLLDELGLDCECFGSTTFKRQDMDSGLEPDQCFYIENHAQMRGKRRINLAVDPPPDLAIEVDVTSKTQVTAYAALGVMELWCYEAGQLKIYGLISGQYQSLEASPSFPGLPVANLVSTALQQSLLIGRSQALRDCRQQVRALLT
ncbi:MAG: Uma2 family endonuclease [Leptolyngbyaceae cyanobacterium SM2_5_2]|nr:Uma2 family endonuclease [Leptolyngbyaceae cyanobacterium SM2_5_2]